MSEPLTRFREIMKACQSMHVLATVDPEGRPHMRWMGALLEDPDTPWTFYLVCMKGSRKMQQLSHNPRAQLLFTKIEGWEIATLSGAAEATDSPELRTMLWDALPAMRPYYTGPQDPKMGILRFTACCGEILSMQDGLQPVTFEV